MCSGQELAHYIQPFPMRGTGWHRCAFVLFEHLKPLDFEFPESRSDQQLQIKDRHFNCKQFFSKFEAHMKPVGLSFFQTEWDLSVKDFFHKTLSLYIFLIKC